MRACVQTQELAFRAGISDLGVGGLSSLELPATPLASTSAGGRGVGLGEGLPAEGALPGLRAHIS